ncbi:MAG: DUF3592 domain-containing protein [Deltaproteobacteria bacterium]|nr:DUF3592 domain-containing protein [Deltaproteobacteria bacterium]
MRFKLRSESEETGPTAALFGSLFFSVFLLFGLFFSYFIGQSVYEGLVSYTWHRHICTITSSSITDKGDKYEFNVEYSYSFKEQPFLSNRFSSSGMRSTDYGELQKLELKYSHGMQVACYINPQSPTVSVLEHGSIFSPLLLLFPLIFFGIGFGGLYAMWIAKRKAAVSQGEQSISKKAKDSYGKNILIILSGIFLLVGFGFLVVAIIMPLMHAMEANTWNPSDCEVISSRVNSHSSDDTTTYSVDILYEYTNNGKQYKSNRYNFSPFTSSSGRDAKSRIVKQYPPGRRFQCFVNPLDPTEAVIERGLNSDNLVIAIVTLLFIGLGAMGLYFGLSSRRRKRRLYALDIANYSSSVVDNADWLPTFKSSGVVTPEGNILLTSNFSPMRDLFFMIIFSAIWNGILSVFVFQAIEGWQNGNPDWFRALFLLPFVLIGAGTAVGIIYCFLALFNPRILLAVSSEQLRLGDTLRVNWKTSGRRHLISHFKIELQGLEEATYRRGTNTYTDKNVFKTIALIDTAQSITVQQGEASATIPVDTMHSFESTNNKIIWKLKVHGVIHRWPDLLAEYLVCILPK